MRISVLIGLLGLAATACSTITIDQETVFQPKGSVTPGTFEDKTLTLTEKEIPVTDSVSLQAWYLRHPSPQATVLFFGGNGFNLVHSRGYIDAFTRPGVNALLVNYRGYGRSGGSPEVDALFRDALVAYDSLVARPEIGSSRVLVWGHSLGSFLATHVARERAVAGLVLENPATNAEGWANHLIPWYMRLLFDVEIADALRKPDNLDRIRSIQAPLLIVTGQNDRVTDPAMGRRLYEAASGSYRKLLEVEGGSHNALYEHPDVQNAYRDLIGQITRN